MYDAKTSKKIVQEEHSPRNSAVKYTGIDKRQEKVKEEG